MIWSKEILVSVPFIDQILSHIQFIGKEVQGKSYNERRCKENPIRIRKLGEEEGLFLHW